MPSDPASRLAAAFDAERFRARGHALVDRLADHLAGIGARRVLAWREPALAREQIARLLAEGGGEGALEELTRTCLESSIQLHHPRFLGHQVTPPLPVAALAELLEAFLNQSLAVYEMSPVATAIEAAVVGWMARALGLGPRADGLLTSGGSLGNLTALLAARRAFGGHDVWREGSTGGPRLALLASAEAHYSVSRAARIMGLGREGVIAVPVDERLHLRPEALGPALDEASRRGLTVFAAVGNACSTAAGVHDPLEPLADFCRAKGLWLHVDGAHGAAAVLSPRYRSLVRGIERADSVVWDAHKMLLQPSLVTGVLLREGERALETFSQEASYLLGRSAASEPHNLSHRTVECTKPALGLRLFATLLVHGEALLAEHVTSAYDRARSLAARIEAAEDLELALPPESNIVCFRHRPAGLVDEEALDAHQERVRRALLERGELYLVQARVRGRLYLRSTLTQPATSERDLDAVLDAVRAAAA
jgi:L-2,4-diaminobutyrate decarboxylase